MRSARTSCTQISAIIWSRRRMGCEGDVLTTTLSSAIPYDSGALVAAGHAVAAREGTTSLSSAR